MSWGMLDCVHLGGCNLADAYTCNDGCEHYETDAQLKKCDMNRQEAERFNDAITCPVKWHAGRKSHKNSCWDRTTRAAPLAHIQLLEYYAKGKMVRMGGNFLCKEGSGSPDFEEYHCQEEDQNGKYDAKVTCKTCLERAKTYGRDSD